jgi:endonuclease-3
MKYKRNVLKIIDELKKLYPEAVCALEYRTDYELLFSARLSAQCTDARVNIVTKTLFKKYPTLKAFAESDLDELMKIVYPCGFFRTKARDIKEAAKTLLDKFGGRVPGTMEELLTLPGIGRKTANLILGDVYGKPAIVADTHCIRISNRLGLAASRDPKKVELELKKIVPPDEQSMLCHRFVWFGRAVCRARGPKCGECPLISVCNYASGQGDGPSA